MAGRLRVTLRKSVVSHTERTRGTVRALGLHHIGDSVDVVDNAATRGMVRAVRFLVDAEEIAGGDGATATTAAATSDAGTGRQENER